MDEPVASQDMLLRFMGVDPLMAAGPAATIASSIGNVSLPQTVIARAFLNGSTILASHLLPSLEEDHPEVPSTSVTPDLDRNREAYYGPRRTITLVLVLSGLVVGLVVMVKWRRRRRYRKDSSLLLGNGKAVDAIRLDRTNSTSSGPSSPLTAKQHTAPQPAINIHSHVENPTLSPASVQPTRSTRERLEQKMAKGTDPEESARLLEGHPASTYEGKSSWLSLRQEAGGLKEQEEVFGLGDDEEDT